MQKRNLIVANTYFQLITAVNLAINNFKEDINDIVITDCSIGMKEKVDNIKNSKIFNEIFFIKCREIIYGNKIKKYFKYLISRNSLLKKNFINKYNEFIFYNLDILSYSLIDELYKYNKYLLCSRYDEGFSTYTIDRKNKKINNFLRTIMFKKNIDKAIKKIYLYHPELLCYETKYNIEKIPNLDKSNSKLKNVLNNIFDYKKIDLKQKYIFFEESFFCDNKGIEDFDLINNIAEIVGKNNLIIKLHPRNKIDRFSKIGIKVWENTGIPWEIYQMNESYSEKIFLTISSGSILASKLYFNEKIHSYFLYNCTEKMSDMVTPEFYNYLELIKKHLDLNDISIPKSKKDFFEELKEVSNND